MKKILTVTIIFLFTMTVYTKAQEVKWYTIEEAVALNKKEPRKILVDVYTDWCGWCKKMDKETWENPVIAKYLNKNFYPVKFNAESTKPIEFEGHTFVNKGEGTRSSHQFAVALLQGKMSYPSIAYMNEDLQLLAAVPGYRTAEQIEPLLHFIVEDKYKTESMDEYMKTFKGSFTADNQ